LREKQPVKTENKQKACLYIIISNVKRTQSIKKYKVNHVISVNKRETKSLWKEIIINSFLYI